MEPEPVAARPIAAAAYGATSYAPYPPASSHGAVSWGAIFAGATVSLVMSVLLTLAAAGIGLAVAYPGMMTRGYLDAFTPVLGAEAIAVQVLAAALGGYLAGRLRTAWTEVHADEAHFRDTAHGLVAWAVATGAGLLLATLVLTPYGASLAAASAMPAAPPTADQIARAAAVSAQSSLFIALGMLLSAFVSAVAARLGGMQNEDMALKGRG